DRREMFLRPNYRAKDGKEHTYWSLVETVRTVDGPRQKTLCYLGELNGSAQARWLKTIEVFNEQGESEQLKLFPSEVEPPADDPQVARVLRLCLVGDAEASAAASARDRSTTLGPHCGQCSAFITDEGAGSALHVAERRHRTTHHGWTRDSPTPDYRTDGRTEIPTAPARPGAT